MPVVGDPATAPTRLRIKYDGSLFSPSLSAVPPGPAVVEVENASSTRGSLLMINWPPEILALTVKPALEFDPYLSGGMLLARQTFRRLFRSERVDEKEGLGIRQVTLLFTDLKGSPAMYERLGDLNAYALVREHFALLAGTFRRDRKDDRRRRNGRVLPAERCGLGGTAHLRRNRAIQCRA